MFGWEGEGEREKGRDKGRGACGCETRADDWCRIFNTGSPHNVAAGNGGADLELLIRHYEEANRGEEEKVRRGIEEREGRR